MSAVFACEKTHICPWANPGLLAGRPGSADKKTRVFFCATPGGPSRHVIPALACAVAWDLCLRLAFPSFSLERKGTKVQGRLHRTSPRLSKRLTFKSGSAYRQTQAPLPESQALSHPLRALPRPAAKPPRPTRLDFGVPVLGVHCFHVSTHYQLLIRQQTTTNDYCRLQTFVQRLSLDRHCIFATQLQNHRKWKNYNKERLDPSTPNSRANRKKP
jgi:hypothetical protein